MPRLSNVAGLGPLADRERVQLDLAYAIVLTARRWKARFAELMKESGQTDARLTTLYYIADAPRGVIQSELAERVGIQGPTLVKLIDALEAQGLVSRRPLIGDRRAKVIWLEDAGREMLAKLDELAGQLRDEVFAEFSDKDLLVAQRMMEHLANRLASKAFQSRSDDTAIEPEDAA